MAPHSDLPRHKPLLATILLSERVLTGENLERALRIWHRRREEGQRKAFGQIVLELRLVTPTLLDHYVALQRRMAPPPGRRRPLGVLALETGVVTATMVTTLLAVQVQTGQRLGDLLVSRAGLRRPQVDTLLMQQRATA
ncbi:MAG: hypothetical protein VKN33_01130 [Candidatus Sericytochromatia bacterium]|nr:hypothetical protein [Candidatus Sericytochromatia bacterium]